MKIYEYLIQIKDGFSDGYRKLQQAAGIANNGVDGTKNKLNEAANSASGFETTVKKLGRTLATVFAIGTISAYAGQVKDATLSVSKYKAAFETTTGSGDKSFEFIRKESDRLGISLIASAEGYKTLSGATMGTNLAGKETERIFSAVAQMAAKMKISAEDQKGSFLALGQMLSKGKVSAEELRGQLGERLSGAFRLFAQAAGVTTMELDKMLQKGEVIAADMLPRFATVLEREFGNGGKYVESFGANVQRASDKALLFKAALGNELEPVMNKYYVTLARAYDWGIRNLDLLKSLAEVVIFSTSGWLTYQSVLWGVSAVTALQAVRISGLSIAQFIAFGTTNGLLGAQMALNAVFMLSPIGWVVGGIMALVGAFILAYNKSEAFRGAIWGLWEASKTVFTNIANFFKEIFSPMFSAIDEFTKGNWGKAAVFAAEFGANLATIPIQLAAKTVTGQTFKGAGDAYNKGYDSGVKKEAISLFGASGVGAANQAGDSSSSTYDPSVQPSANASGISGETGGKGKGVNVNVNLGGIEIVLNVANLDEGLDQVEEKVKMVISRIINGGIYTATQ